MNFESLANENKDAVYRQLIRVCGNREDAEDVLIDALLKAYRNLDQLRDSAAFRGWLAQIGRPVWQLSVMEEEGQELADRAVPLDVQIGNAQIKEFLREAVARLEPPYRLV